MWTLAGRSFEYWLFNYRRTWRGTVVSSLLNPLLYLAAMGVGLGTLVNDGGSPGAAQLAGVSYLAFVAPGVLAAAAMQVAAFDGTYPVMGAHKWTKVYHAMIATPLGAREVMLGHLGFLLFRVTTSSLAFMVVMAAFGVFASPWAVLALPAAVLTGMAFAAPIVAFSITTNADSAFAALFRFGVVPMFLFSGTFFPVSQLPELVRPLAYVTPLWHGVELSRGLSLGAAEPASALGHVGYLGLWVVVGTVVAAVAYRRRLVT